jgi:hypothetical protein
MHAKILVLVALFTPLSALAQEKEKEKTISEWGWGLGIGIEQYRQQAYLDQASTYGTDRAVVVEKDYRTNPSAWMTLNWNVWPRPKLAAELKALGKTTDVEKVKWGFFAGVKLLVRLHSVRR